jgi:hypothetical protein
VRPPTTDRSARSRECPTGVIVRESRSVAHRPAYAHNGGPGLAFRLDPERARRAAGFDYFAVGLPDKDSNTTGRVLRRG